MTYVETKYAIPEKNVTDLDKLPSQGSEVLVSCVLLAREAKSADVIIFPEGALLTEMMAARLSHPQAAIVGAIKDRGRSRGVLLHQERNQIDYLKVGSDGRTKGSGDRRQKPVYEMGDVCIGVLICMDVDDTAFARAVIERIRTSPAKVKLLCIPAEAGSHWFSNAPLFIERQLTAQKEVLCLQRVSPSDR